MERYVIIDDKGNYVVQFLTITHSDGTSTTRLQTVNKNDIDFIINECSFNSLEATEEYLQSLILDSKSLKLNVEFKIERLTLRNTTKTESKCNYK